MVWLSAETCGGNDESNADGNEDTGNDNAAAALEGSVVIDGSGTVYPLMSKMAENYMGMKKKMFRLKLVVLEQVQDSESFWWIKTEQISMMLLVRLRMRKNRS